MRHPLKHLGRILACLALGGITLSAQQPLGFDTQLKLRAGFQVGSAKDNLTRRTMGFGLEGGYTFAWGRLALEVGYQNKPGDQYNAGTSNMIAGTTSVTSVDPAVVGTATFNDNPDWGLFTGDQRRNSIEGITLRLSYETNFNSSWGAAAGVQLGGAKFKHEFTGNAYGNYLDATGAYIEDPGGSMLDPDGNFYMAEYFDTYLGARTKSKVAVSPFVGLRYRINEQNCFELNVIGVSYTAINYIHVAGTVDANVDGYGGHTASDFFTEKKRTVPHIEFGYSFRF
jgi:hypothetical protein